ncbi:MAG: NuA4 histone H4 acetyltransferase complex and the SWR1 complex subunit [Thelocarpon impressellum]|nr:MAG: NuA4 histone H4 acetyltransferase complex and the SWR1 complex subunit [Thelocarpon impressellum]
MPAPTGNKRVKGVSIFRPFVFGNTTRHIDPNKRPANLDKDHTHQWTLFVKGVDDDDISYWLKKVQFKLHDSYNNSLRTIEQPPFEVHETGWGEFDVAIKLYFVPESGEKPQTLWHTLKIHPYGPDAEIQRIEKRPIISQNYEEIIFNEPVEQFYEILTGGPEKATKGKGSGKGGSKQASMGRGGHEGRTVELPQRETRDNPYSKDTEGKELDRMKEALRKVDEMIARERERLSGKEVMLDSLRRAEGVPPKKK